MADPHAFRLEKVTLAWDDGRIALGNVSLAIGAGEAVALLGANGSGKTTLLRVLNGLQFPTSGTVLAFGEEVSERALRADAAARRFRRRVGFVFQSSEAQLFSATVREEIAFAPLQLELSREEVVRRIDDLARLLEIGPLLDRPPYRLSGGEKRKVALGSVLAVNPEAILLDEPTTGLDPRSQVGLVRMLRALHRAGKTIVAATNDLELLPRIADRAVVLDEAHQIVADGPVREILADRALLLRANLIHEQSHWHGDLLHDHPDGEAGHRHPAGTGEGS